MKKWNLIQNPHHYFAKFLKNHLLFPTWKENDLDCKRVGSNLGIWETSHLPLPEAIIFP